MQRNHCRAFLAVTFLVLCAAVPIPVFAQPQDELPTKITNQNRSGDLPFSTTVGTDVERVDIGSGNLIMTIPIVSTPGRGMGFHFGLRYDARFLVVNSRFAQPNGWHNNWNIEGTTAQWLNDAIGWTGNPSRLSWATKTLDCTEFDHSTYHMFYMFRDADGVKHPVTYQQATGNPSLCGGFIDDNAPDLAGEGIRAKGPGITPAIVFPDGTTRSGPALASMWLDTNGNFQTGDGPGATDTLGRVILTQQNGTNQIFYKVYDSNGVQQTYTVNFTSLSVSTSFNVSGPFGPISEYATTRSRISSIVLPNGRSYQFQYENGSYGAITRIDLPTGGYVTYTWATHSDTHRTLRYVASRTVNVNGQSYTWNFSRTGSGDAITVTVTDPLSNQSVYNVNSGTIELAKFYQGIATGTPLKQVAIVYVWDEDPWQDSQTANDPLYEAQKVARRPIRITTTLDNNLVTKKEFDYDSLTYNYHPYFDPYTWNQVETFTTSRGNVTEIREFGYGTDPNTLPLLRRTKKEYLSGTSKVTKETICDGVVACNGTGDQTAQTQFEYDQYLADNPITPTSNAPQHDYTNYSSSFTARLNVTRVKHWRNTDGALLTTTYTYDDLGNIRAIKDPLTHTTSYLYDDSWANSSCLPPTNSLAFVTQITNALTQRVQFKYWPCTGLRQTRKDENDILASRTGVTSTYDLMGRLTQQNLPDGGQTSNTYNDTPPVTVTATTKITTSLNLVRTSVMDELGREKQSKLTSDPQGIVYVDTTYDGLDRTATVTNPYRSTGETTYGITTSQYDALGRVTQVIPPDGLAGFNSITTSYSGNVTTVTDQAGKQRRSITDALGRLTEVDEPGGTSAPTPGRGGAVVSGSEQIKPTGTPGTGSVVIGGSEKRFWDLSCPCYIYDEGSVIITVNGFAVWVGYAQGSTSSAIANSLAAELNAPSSPVTATVAGSTVYLTSKAVGSASNYSLSTTVYWDTLYFTSASFTATRSGPTLTGGTDGAPIYDTGTVWVTVNGFQALVNYGQGSTASSVASGIASILNTNPSSPVTATLYSATLSLTAKTNGSATNYSLSGGSTTSQPTNFTQPSFSVAVSGATLTGGADIGPGTLATPAVTLYTYEVLGNLTCVVQKGTDTATFTNCAAAPATWRPRSFTYNSLSQLLTASNPESGAISYTYDNDGNLLTKVSPAPNQTNPAVTVTTTFAYDQLHRLTGKTYSNGDPAVSYLYDQTSYNGLTIANGKGQRTGMSDTSGTTAWSYDLVVNVGWKTTERRTLAGITKTIISQNNLAGSLAQLTYPSGRIITYTPDAAGRTLSAVDTANGINYALNASYAPSGALASIQNGANIVSTFYYNNRLQPCRISVKSSGTAPATCADATNVGNVLDFTYGFSAGTANNGNVASIANNRSTGRSQSFTYDELNRIKTAQSAATSGGDCWGLQFGYDVWANLLSAGVTKCSPPALSVGVSTKNQINNASFQYDAAGNLTFDGSLSATYDAENRIASTNAGVTYAYDGDGKRVKKSNGKLYWTGTGSDPLEETNLSGVASADFIFFGGKRTARLDLPGAAVHYYFANHLGTANVVTSSTGTIQDESDFYPFGGERVVTDTDANQYKFTGKERDTESGLDFFIARYYSASYGRFLSPDEFAGGPVDVFSSNDPLPPGPLPYADISNPQSLNKYTYTFNNPLRYTDPDGHWIDTVLDVAFIAYDVYKIVKEGPTSENKLALAADVGAALIPGVTGAGAGVRAASKTAHALEGVRAGEKVVEGVKAGEKVAEGIKLGTKTESAATIASKIDRAAFKSEREAFWKAEAKNNATKYSKEDLARMDKGKPPIGADGHPTELHHKGQTMEGGVQPMTRTDHRLGANYKKNHPPQ